MSLLLSEHPNLFPTSYDEIEQRVRHIDPVKYGRSRNFVDGAVTYLSPYISRGVISTKYVLTQTLKRGYEPKAIEKFIQELAWRDYWQQIWIAKGDAINSDLKNSQTPVSNTSIPRAIVEASTGIDAVDEAISQFYETGYMHNHMRMYIASIACNVGQSQWKIPAQWLYYHLLDGDWASNALSWQWVAGANSHKKYYANQDNINKYFHSKQKGTFLDVEYDKFNEMGIPEVLLELSSFYMETTLPHPKVIEINKNLPVCIYNYFNLDPLWKEDIAANRVLLLEPSHFKKYPICKKSVDFMLALSEN
ncbi:MAG: deoxyribodipyrimidine photolyase, partial [Flavobacteriaceae bacterium]|nr:deoxyribodipyrimidine photolyase [Flavobacteriaceae bacterium]